MDEKQKRMEELKNKLSQHRELQRIKRKMITPITPPRYDDVYFNGISELFGDDN